MKRVNMIKVHSALLLTYSYVFESNFIGIWTER